MIILLATTAVDGFPQRRSMGISAEMDRKRVVVVPEARRDTNSEVDLDRGDPAFDDASRLQGLEELLDDRVAIGIRASVEVAGSWAEAVGDVERGLVLSESTRCDVPFSRCRTGSRALAKKVDDGFWSLRPRDAGAYAEVTFDSLVDLVDRRLHLGPMLEHRRC
jgi:hypothetical protein